MDMMKLLGMLSAGMTIKVEDYEANVETDLGGYIAIVSGEDTVKPMPISMTIKAKSMEFEIHMN